MQPVNLGVIGLGNVGTGTLDILAENAEQIAQKLGFPLRVAAVCSRSVSSKKLPAALGLRCEPRIGARWWRIPTFRSSPN